MRSFANIHRLLSVIAVFSLFTASGLRDTLADTPTEKYRALQAAINMHVNKRLKDLPETIENDIKSIPQDDISNAVARPVALILQQNKLMLNSAEDVSRMPQDDLLKPAAGKAVMQTVRLKVQNTINASALSVVGVSDVDGHVADINKELTQKVDASLIQVTGRGLATLPEDKRAAITRLIAAESQNIVSAQTREVTGVVPYYSAAPQGFTMPRINGSSLVYNSGVTEALGVTPEQLNSMSLTKSLNEVSATAKQQVIDDVANELKNWNIDLSDLSAGEVTSIISSTLPGAVATKIRAVDYTSAMKTPAITLGIESGLTDGFKAALSDRMDQPEMRSAIDKAIDTISKDTLTSLTTKRHSALETPAGRTLADARPGLLARALDLIIPSAAAAEAAPQASSEISSALINAMAAPALADAAAPAATFTPGPGDGWGIGDYFPDDVLGSFGTFGDYMGMVGSFANFGYPLLMDYDYASTGDEDRRYAELCLDNVEDDVNKELGVGIEINGTRPQLAEGECMPHKTTRLFSPLELSPWYLLSVQSIDPTLPGPYVGPIYRGAANSYRYAHRMTQIGKVEVTLPDATKKEVPTATNTCFTDSPDGKSPLNLVNDTPENPLGVRAEVDNCVNNYILSRSDLPRIPSDSLGKKVAVRELGATYCQPLKMQPMSGEQEEEYYPDYYYVAAWHKLLNDAEYTVRGRLAPQEPYYAALLRGVGGGGIDNPQQVRDDYGQVSINDLTEYQFERIYDPSHPFSPRWDFDTNEVDAFSKIATAAYGAPQEDVYCSGYKTKGIKTDILNWRYPGYAFYMDWRIGFNAICLDSEYCSYVFECSADTPCCAVNYTQTDHAPPIFCGPPSIGDLCSHITKPVVPVNVLKMREVTKEDFPNGVQKAYRFKTYFGKNRPYMRCWDTGLECGQDSPEADQDTTTGSEYAIVGAGREAENCMVGGGLGSTVSVADPTGTQDPIMDWMELKLYQVRGAREIGISCLPMEEKMNNGKLASGEEMVLSRTGAQFQIAWSELGEGADEQNRIKTTGWPFSWRGYITDPKVENRFPNFGGAGPAMATGMDDVEVGEALVYDEDIVMEGIAGQDGATRENATGPGGDGKWRNPYVAFVTAVNNVKAKGGQEGPDDFIKAIAFNHGKIIDACANSEYAGQGEEYTMYKSALPDYNMQELNDDRLVAPKPETGCDDPYMSFCIEDKWTKVKRFSSYRDRRVTDTKDPPAGP